ncbi:hypothetical protein C1U56_08310 [Campylobacter jejuni]|nr:hypothetical protein [Campylobacter jejuni]
MNKYLFDTSSLISFVRYYIPFDEDLILRKFLLSGFNDNSFLLLNEVKMECKRVSSGLVFKEF